MFGLGTAKKNSLPLRIGRAASGGNFWKGMIDDVSLWNTALNLDDVRKLRYQRLGGNEEGLVGAWYFNEGTGTVTVDHTPARRDATIFSNDQIKWVPSEEKDLILNLCV